MNPIIEHNFRYHPPRGGAARFHEAIRAKAKELEGPTVGRTEGEKQGTTSAG